ncbi:uncharacterized protein YALI1_D35325g [Yarrowia lipolytica]|uniref:Uncharacterized protein n=1 Tax=Yarrowia lipolytica TaxID=4952 RepID=A0A1D8NGD1_YARLL|nr:hypothetical protein YALI1_D35325g [Yarrowia lipolytica]
MRRWLVGWLDIIPEFLIYILTKQYYIESDPRHTLSLHDRFCHRVHLTILCIRDINWSHSLLYIAIPFPLLPFFNSLDLTREIPQPHIYSTRNEALGDCHIHLHFLDILPVRYRHSSAPVLTRGLRVCTLLDVSFRCEMTIVLSFY